jgi:hypothetical protein
VITTAWLGDDRHLDIAGAARWNAKRVELEARLGTRPWTQNSGGVGEALSGVWGEMSALVPLTQNISLTMSGGSYPSDPVRRVLGANYLTAGLRIATSHIEQPPALIDPEPIITAARARNATTSATPARLEIAIAGAMRSILPEGARQEQDEFGGVVGIIIIR